LRRVIVVVLLLGAIAFGWVKWRDSSRQNLPEGSGPAISKLPIASANRTFDPAAPPADMPPLRRGESAECDSNFLSNASVSGESRQTDAAHAVLTITQVRMTLQLKITIWAPVGATEQVLQHEDGHRQISEYYYQTADKLAQRIAATYIGKQVEITGTDLNAVSSAMLQQLADEITGEYDKELNPESAQLLYDALTNHGRNDTPVKDAIATALRDVKVASTQAATNPGN
jgi:hypothetical protein